MKGPLSPLETLWDHLLSRDADLVRSAFKQLEPEEQQAVLAHLWRMSSEPGWHPEQRSSAQAALVLLAQRSFIEETL